MRKTLAFLAILMIALLAAGCKQAPADQNISGQPKAAGNNTPSAQIVQPDANETAELNQLIVSPSANATAAAGNQTAGNATSSENATALAAPEEQEPQVVEGLNLTVHFIDVRHGDSVFIQSPHNGTMLIDGGFNSQGGPLMHYLRDLGMKDYLDVVMASNSDNYHVGGLGAVLFNMATVSEILHNGIDSGEQSYMGFSQFGRAKGMFVAVANDKEEKLDDAMRIDLMVPYAEGYFNKTEDNSIVTKITYGTVSMLLMSDCTQDCEKKLKGRDLKADILKVAHYAWNDSTSEEFLEQVNPKVAIISTGDLNDFPVPDSLVLQRLLDKGVRILRTDINGTIVVTTDGTDYWIRTLK